MAKKFNWFDYLEGVRINNSIDFPKPTHFGEIRVEISHIRHFGEFRGEYVVSGPKDRLLAINERGIDEVATSPAMKEIGYLALERFKSEIDDLLAERETQYHVALTERKRAKGHG